MNPNSLLFNLVCFWLGLVSKLRLAATIQVCFLFFCFVLFVCLFVCLFLFVVGGGGGILFFMNSRAYMIGTQRAGPQWILTND